MTSFSSRVAKTIAFAAVLAASTAPAAEWFGEIGYGRADFGSTFATTPDAYSVGVGVLFNEYFGAQLERSYTGTPDPAPCPGLCVIYITPEHMDSLRLLGRLPLGDSFELLGGFGRVKSENSTYDYTRYSDLLSFSAGWRINDTFTLSIQRQVASVNSGIADDAKIDTVTLRYRF